MLRQFPPGRLAEVNGGQPDAQGLTGTNAANGKWLEAGPQRGSCRGVIAAVVADDLAAADHAWRGIDLAFAHQLPDGSFEANVRPNGASAKPRAAAVETAYFFLQELGRAVLVIGESPYEKHFRERIAVIEPKMRLACRFVLAGYDTIIQSSGHDVNRIFIAAKALGLCGLALHEDDFIAGSRRLVAYGLTRRDVDGVFIENGGRDSSYNTVSILMGEVLALHLDIPEFERALPAAVAWELTRISPTGQVLVGGNTRTGVNKEFGYTGEPKGVNYGEIVASLTIYGLVHHDPAALAAAERAYGYMHRPHGDAK